MSNEHVELSRLRQQIDEIDQSIIDHIAKRRQISKKIGKYKKVKKLPVRQKKREKRALQKRINQSQKKNISPKFTKRLFRLIFHDSRSIQKHPSGFDKKGKN